MFARIVARKYLATLIRITEEGLEFHQCVVALHNFNELYLITEIGFPESKKTVEFSSTVRFTSMNPRLFGEIFLLIFSGST